MPLLLVSRYISSWFSRQCFLNGLINTRLIFRLRFSFSWVFYLNLRHCFFFINCRLFYIFWCFFFRFNFFLNLLRSFRFFFLNYFLRCFFLFLRSNFFLRLYWKWSNRFTAFFASA